MFKGPFAERWPGALMVVFKRHLREITDLNSEVHSRISAELYAFEKAIRTDTSCARINTVKFGNVCEHLHWHLIPRYSHELFAQKTSWEVAHLKSSELFADGQLPLVNYTALASQCAFMGAHKIPPHFSTALFLRPQAEHRPANFADWTLDQILETARQCPAQWECFLMQRNYKDYAWDSFGGGADANERPEQTLKREIREELGWELSAYQEVCRQWNHGLLRGFVYVAVPSEPTWFHDSPQRVECDEVKQAGYHGLPSLMESSQFLPYLRGRIQALVSRRHDFDR